MSNKKLFLIEDMSYFSNNNESIKEKMTQEEKKSLKHDVSVLKTKLKFNKKEYISIFKKCCKYKFKKDETELRELFTEFIWGLDEILSKEKEMIALEEKYKRIKEQNSFNPDLKTIDELSETDKLMVNSEHIENKNDILKLLNIKKMKIQ